VRCDHEHDDGAYVLGALSPAERAAYERHLSTCSFCREAVADIAVLPGLLGRLDPADFAKLLDPTLSPPAPPPNRTPDLVTAAQRTRRKERKQMRVRVLSTALAAAVVALVVGVGAVFWMDSGAPPAPTAGPMAAMTRMADEVPVTAKVQVTPMDGATKVNLICSYRKTSASKEAYTIWLKAMGRDGETDTMGSWVASPGADFSMSGVTHLAGNALTRLVLVRSDGKVLLAYDVP